MDDIAEVVEEQPWVTVEYGEHTLMVRAGGAWVMTTTAALEPQIDAVRAGPEPAAVVDVSDVSRMDTTGAWLLYKVARLLRQAGQDVSFKGADPIQQSLLDAVSANDNPCAIAPPARNSLLRQVEEVGMGTISVVTAFGALLSFLGLVLARFLGALRHWDRLRLAPLVHQMEHVGLKAMPIVGLISFLIGAVIVNQGAVQLRKFGADVLVVDMLAISQLRELGILLTAIIVAGRSGSAFTAQIGSMNLHEEIDAMKTLGLNPIDLLVLPRLLALVLMLPLLTFYADLMGLLGGGLMAWVTLDISPGTFLTQLGEAATMTDFMVGFIKAPVFAIVIAVCGCFEGMSVRGGAEAVGHHTTRSVVESIFLVIVLNALFAVFFTTIGW